MQRAVKVDLSSPHDLRLANVVAVAMAQPLSRDRKTYDWSAIRAALVEPEKAAPPQLEMLFVFAD